jgi:hypothetical protein
MTHGCAYCVGAAGVAGAVLLPVTGVTVGVVQVIDATSAAAVKLKTCYMRANRVCQPPAVQ